MNKFKSILLAVVVLVVTFGIVVFVNAARSQYGYIGIYNSSSITLSEDEGAALAIDANGYLQISDTSQLGTLTVGSLYVTSTIGVGTSTPQGELMVTGETLTTTIWAGDLNNIGEICLGDADKAGGTCCDALNGVLTCRAVSAY